MSCTKVMKKVLRMQYRKKGDVECDVTNESDGKGESHEVVMDAEQKKGDVKDRSDKNNVKEKNAEAGEDDKGKLAVTKKLQRKTCWKDMSIRFYMMKL